MQEVLVSHQSSHVQLYIHVKEGVPFLSSFRIGELLDSSSGEELPATAVPFDAASEQAMEEQKCVCVRVCVCVCGYYELP